MSTQAETIEQALGEEPKTRQAIAEETGIEVGAVSTTLTLLRGQGRAQRSAEGWSAGDGVAPARVHRHVAAEPVAEHDAPKKRGKPAKGRRPKPGIRVQSP